MHPDWMTTSTHFFVCEHLDGSKKQLIHHLTVSHVSCPSPVLLSHSQKKTKNTGQTHIRFMLAVRIFFISHLGIGLRVQAFCLMALDRSVDGNPALSRPLEDILSEAGLDSVLGNSLISKGWTTKTFALAATSLAEFKPDSLTAEDVSPLQQACLRVAWQSCQGSSSSSTAPFFFWTLLRSS